MKLGTIPACDTRGSHGGVATPITETIQVLDLGSGYKILTINTNFYDDFFSFSKQTAATEPSLCHAVV